MRSHDEMFTEGHNAGYEIARREIRRAIAGPLRELRDHARDTGCGPCEEYCAAIYKATRAPRKVRTK